MNITPIRQNSTSKVSIGPFFDDTDFKTLEDGLTIANTDIKLSKVGEADVNKNSGGATSTGSGSYSIILDATDSSTVGEMKLTVSVAGAMPVVKCFQVMEEAVYDALYASGATGPTTAAAVADAVWDEAQADHSIAGTFGQQMEDLEMIMDKMSFTDDTHLLVDADYVQGMQLTGSAYTGFNYFFNEASPNKRVNDVGAMASVPTAADIADAVWDEATVDHTMGGTFGDQLIMNQSSLIGITDNIQSISEGIENTQITHSSNLNEIIADVTGINGDAMRGTDGAYTGTPTEPPTVGAIADAVWTEILADHSGVVGSTAESLNSAASGGGHTAQDVADLILLTPANKLATDASGFTTAAVVNDKTGYSLTQVFPTNFEDLAIEVTTGKVTTSNPAAGTGSAHTAEDVAALILEAPATPLANAGGKVTVGTNDDKSGYTIAGVIQDLDTLNGNMEADFTSTNLAISGVASDTGAIKVVTDKEDTMLEADGSGGFQLTTLALDNAAGGAGFTAQDVADLILITPANKLATDASGFTTAGTVNDKTGYSLTQVFPTNFEDLAIEVTTGKVTTSNPAAGTGSAHTAEDVAALILEAPATPLANAGGKVTVGTNDDKTGYTIAGTVQDLDTLNGNMTSSFVSTDLAISGVASDTGAIKVVTDKENTMLEADGSGGFQLTTLALENAAGGGAGFTAQDVADLILITPANKLATDVSGYTTVGTNNDKTGYSLTQVFPTNFEDLAITVTTGMVTTANPAAGGGSAHTAEDVAALILEAPATPLANAGGKVTVGTNDDKIGYTIAGTIQDLDTLDSNMDSNFIVTNSLVSNVAITANAIQDVTDKEDTMLEADGSGGFQLTSLALENGPAGGGGGGDATELNQTTIITHLTDIKGAGWTTSDNLALLSTGGPAGSGATLHTITVTVEGVPVEGASVWITTDPEGTNVVAGFLTTNLLGQVEFYLDAGEIYYQWAKKGGVDFTNPTSFLVS